MISWPTLNIYLLSLYLSNGTFIPGIPGSLLEKIGFSPVEFLFKRLGKKYFGQDGHVDSLHNQEYLQIIHVSGLTVALKEVYNVSMQ